MENQPTIIPPNCTVTVNSANLFSIGDIVEIGQWPRWFYCWHLPKWAMKSIRFVCKLFGKRIGPQVCTVIDTVKGTEISITE